ncbi:MAG: hypothetical protein HY553_16745 [Elusimicrobia bacterium]|nr:hypothetical protein [Elusimicrobiota bacterium]
MYSVLLAGLLATGASAQPSAVLPEAAPIQQPQMLDLNLMEALVTVGAHDLAGVFGFVPAEAAPAALADYLLHNRKALKKLLKKGQRDLKELGGVNGWEKMVFIQILQLHSNGPIPPGVERLSKKEEYDVSEIVLARPMTLQEMTTLRGMKK